MPGEKFFPKVELNCAENLLRFDDDQMALVSISEARETTRLTYAQLSKQLAKIADGLRSLSVGQGDRVADFVPNIAESVIVMLAVTSLGAAWSSYSPDFGIQGVIDRFGQIKPKVLFTANAYKYNGKLFDCLTKVEGITWAISEIEKVVIIPLSDKSSMTSPALESKSIPWDGFGNDVGRIDFNRISFNDPLYVMYSSGTTGLPKCIDHGVGGTLMKHYKELVLHSDLRRKSRIMCFTICGWMMLNWLVSCLFIGCDVVLFDGSHAHHGPERLWSILENERVTHFGTSPKFIEGIRGNIKPGKQFYLGSLEVILSTGAPLLQEDFDWVYKEVKPGVRLSSIRGGTDIVSCFMLGSPILPVYSGELQCYGLGMDVAVYDENNNSVFGAKGELVCQKPFISMPIHFWNNLEKALYKKRISGARKASGSMEITYNIPACKVALGA